MDVSFLSSVGSSFHYVVENEINTLSKLTLGDLVSVAVGFTFIIASIFIQESK